MLKEEPKPLQFYLECSQGVRAKMAKRIFEEEGVTAQYLVIKLVTLASLNRLDSSAEELGLLYLALSKYESESVADSFFKTRDIEIPQDQLDWARKEQRRRNVKSFSLLEKEFKLFRSESRRNAMELELRTYIEKNEGRIDNLSSKHEADSLLHGLDRFIALSLTQRQERKARKMKRELLERRQLILDKERADKWRRNREAKLRRESQKSKRP
jgi:hypothetical protein